MQIWCVLFQSGSLSNWINFLRTCFFRIFFFSVTISECWECELGVPTDLLPESEFATDDLNIRFPWTQEPTRCGWRNNVIFMEQAKKERKKEMVVLVSFSCSSEMGLLLARGGTR